MLLVEVIKNTLTGILYFQNKEYISTTDIVREIAIHNKQKVRFWSLPNYLIKILLLTIPNANKVFGDFYYNSSDIFITDDLIDFKESIANIVNNLRKRTL